MTTPPGIRTPVLKVRKENRKISPENLLSGPIRLSTLLVPLYNNLLIPFFMWVDEDGCQGGVARSWIGFWPFDGGSDGDQSSSIWYREAPGRRRTMVPRRRAPFCPSCFACCCLFLSGDSAVVAGFVFWFLFIFRVFPSVWAFFWLFCGSFWCCVAFFLPGCGLEKGRKEGGTAAETSARYLRLFRSSFLTPTLHLVRNILRSIEGLFVTVIG